MFITEEQLGTIAARQINGRQIKNTMKMARLLAKSKQRPLVVTDVEHALTTLRSFGNVNLRVDEDWE
jgi:hypothetical protein